MRGKRAGGETGTREDSLTPTAAAFLRSHNESSYNRLTARVLLTDCPFSLFRQSVHGSDRQPVSVSLAYD